MLTRVAKFSVRRKWLVLVGTLLALVVAGAAGGNVAEHLSSGGFDDPNAEYSQAKELLEKDFGGGDPNLVLLVTARNGTVDSAEVAAVGQELTGRLAGEEGVKQAVSYWTLGSPPPLKSHDATQALVLARIGGSEDDVRDRVEELSPKYQAASNDVVTIGVGGYSEIFRQVGTTIEKDLARAEGIAIPITMILLVLVFGSVVAAALPLAVGIFAILGTFLMLRLIASITDVSIFSLNLTTAMGLALAIDYSLFIVSRYREELRHGLAPDDAVVRTVQTAGRTVVVSAFTVAISLSALLIFPLYFLRSFAYAGVAVVAVAMVGAIVTLPALLAVLGHRIDKFALFKRHPKEVGEGLWHRIAVTVMKRPLPFAAGVIALLLFLGIPFLHIKFGLPDDRVLPKSASSRQVSDQLRTNFSSFESLSLSVVAQGVDARTRAADITTYAAALSQLDGVARVDAATGSYIRGQQVAPPGPASVRFAPAAGTFLSVVPSVEPISGAGEHLVHEVRDAPSPFPVKVTGASAQLVDSKHALFSRLPLAALLIGIITFTVLFLMFGSVLVPAKAVVLNILSLAATFGAMVFIFQEGHLSNALNFTATGTIDTTTPILMFCVAFGLSMDYEVFLLSRIKEEHDRTGDNEASVAVGLERTGRIVTAAAVLMAIVFSAMATSSVAFIKLFGVGLTMAVLMDATLIRGTLVPAFMRLAGNANWWAPRFLRPIHERFGIKELADDDAPQPAPAVLDLTDGYAERVRRQAAAIADEAELRQFLEQEGLTLDDLARSRR